MDFRLALRAPRNDGESSARLLQYRDEEPVGAGAEWRHQPALRRLQRGLRKLFGLVPEHARGLLRRYDGELGMAADEGADLLAILLRQDRAGDVGDAAAFLHQRRGALQELALGSNPDLPWARKHAPFG